MNIPIYYKEKEMNEIEEFIFENTNEDLGYICHELTSEYVHSDIVVTYTEVLSKFTTMGMGARKMKAPNDTPKNIEIFMVALPNKTDKSSSENKIICKELLAITKIPFRENSWLGMFHTIDASGGFQDQFGYQGVCLLPTEHQIKLSSGKAIALLQALPVYQKEMEWLWKQGNDLDSIFDFVSTIEDYYMENDLPFGAVNVKRPILVPDSQ